MTSNQYPDIVAQTATRSGRLFLSTLSRRWVVSGAQNLAYVKPAKAAAETNLNLVTTSGTLYSSLLTEGTSDVDLKAYVEPDESTKGTAGGTKKFYSGADVDERRQAADVAKTRNSESQGGRAVTTIAKPRAVMGDHYPFSSLD